MLSDMKTIAVLLKVFDESQHIGKAVGFEGVLIDGVPIF
jgi:hypothetical protein